ncbi:MAG: TonB-dependent receptor, partial [Bacteroidetes bacterium]|nr:TonB-dependent receptor [Bacteroidota bacterium]
MSKPLIITCCVLLSCLGAIAQAKFTISGTIRSKKTGETIIGATVHVAGQSIGTVSNEYGFYSLTLPTGTYTIEFSTVGLQPVQEEIALTQHTIRNIALDDAAQSLKSVTITANTKQRNLSTPQMGMEQLTTKEMKNIPVLLGEKDVLKTIQLLPGIKSAGDGNSGFYVRGGGADQNLILLDEAPVYNASHLFGFFSTFNSDAIKDVTVYKGGMPAQYGGRLSSVLDIKMN